MALSKFKNIESEMETDIEVVLDGQVVHPDSKGYIFQEMKDECIRSGVIPGLGKKVEDIILSDKRHPAMRLHPEYLWEKIPL